MPDCNTGKLKKRSYNGDYMEVGKKAESIVMSWAKNHPGVLGVEDLTHLRPLQEADVDCSIKTIDGTVTLAEIKSDKYIKPEGNVLFEVLRINHTAPHDKSVTLGWTARSPATWILYYSPTLNTIFQCRFSDLRKVFQSHTHKKRSRTRISYVSTDSIKSTINILIPFSECSDIFTLHKL